MMNSFVNQEASISFPEFINGDLKNISIKVIGTETKNLLETYVKINL